MWTTILLCRDSSTEFHSHNNVVASICFGCLCLFAPLWAKGSGGQQPFRVSQCLTVALYGSLVTNAFLRVVCPLYFILEMYLSRSFVHFNWIIWFWLLNCLSPYLLWLLTLCQINNPCLFAPRVRFAFGSSDYLIGSSELCSLTEHHWATLALVSTALRVLSGKTVA